MKNLIIYIALLIPFIGFTQKVSRAFDTKVDSTTTSNDSIFIWSEKLYVYVALAHLESNFCDDVFSCLDKKIKYNDRF